MEGSPVLNVHYIFINWPMASCKQGLWSSLQNPTGKVTDKEVELDYYLDVPKTQSAAPSDSVVID